MTKPEEKWDPAQVAAECKAAADKKERKKRKRRAVPMPEFVARERDDDPPKGKDASGRFLPGHTYGGPREGSITTLYMPEFPGQVRHLARLGATMAEIADFFDVSVRSIYEWKYVHDEFAEALKVGKDLADDRVERSMYELAVGYDYAEDVVIHVDGDAKVVRLQKHMPPNPYSNFKWLCNRRRGEWSDKQTIEVNRTVHISASDARRELEDFMRGEAIEGEFTALPPPDLGTDADRAADDF